MRMHAAAPSTVQLGQCSVHDKAVVHKLTWHGEITDAKSSRKGFGFRLCIHFINQVSVAFLNSATSHFKGVCHGSIGRRKFFGYQQHTFHFSKRARFWLSSSTMPSYSACTLGFATSACREAKSTWLARAQFSSTGKCGAMSTAGNFRRSPRTTAVPMSGFSFREFSIGCGAMNFPPEVLIRSFLRSVIER